MTRNNGPSGPNTSFSEASGGQNEPSSDECEIVEQTADALVQCNHPAEAVEIGPVTVIVCPEHAAKIRNERERLREKRAKARVAAGTASELTD